MITIVFTKSNSWISKVIRWFTRGKSSHVMIGTRVHGIQMFLHSTAGGVQFTPRPKELKGCTVVAEYKVVPYVEPGLRKAISYVGDKYDYLGLFGYAWVIALWRLFKKKVRNPLASPRSMVCSEFVASLDRTGKYLPEFAELDPEKTHPEHLRKICESSKNFERIV